MEKRMQLAKGNDLLVTAISFIFFRVCVVVCSAALLPFAFPFRWPLALHHPIVLVLFCFLFFRKSSLAGHRPSAPWPCVMEIKSHISGAQVYIAYSLKRRKKRDELLLINRTGQPTRNRTTEPPMNLWINEPAHLILSPWVSRRRKRRRKEVHHCVAESLSSSSFLTFGSFESILSCFWCARFNRSFKSSALAVGGISIWTRGESCWAMMMIGRKSQRLLHASLHGAE